MREITVCTGNQGKKAEFQRILKRPLVAVDLSIDEIQAIDPERVCFEKARRAYDVLKIPVLVDDTSFALEALDGFPGALVTWVLQSGGPELLFRMLPHGSSAVATAVTALGFADELGVRTFVGSLPGTVIASPRGLGGFGFDSVFIPDGFQRTLAEMTDAEKDSVSPRGIALRKLAAFLADEQ